MNIQDISIVSGLKTEIISYYTTKKYHVCHVNFNKFISTAKQKQIAQMLSLRWGTPTSFEPSRIAMYAIVSRVQQNIKTDVTPVYKDGYIVFGQDIYNKMLGLKISSIDHILIAGSTGCGKSVMLNTIIDQLSRNWNNTYSFIDLKVIELSKYGYMGNVAIDSYGALQELKNIQNMMKQRYYNNSLLNHHYVIIDELAELMLDSTYKNELKDVIQSIAQMGRAANIHLIVATQKPMANIIPTLIRDNITTKIAMRCTTAQASRCIYDRSGAENLFGEGDAYLLTKNNPNPQRFAATITPIPEQAQNYQPPNYQPPKPVKTKQQREFDTALRTACAISITKDLKSIFKDLFKK